MRLSSLSLPRAVFPPPSQEWSQLGEPFAPKRLLRRNLDSRGCPSRKLGAGKERRFRGGVQMSESMKKLKFETRAHSEAKNREDRGAHWPCRASNASESARTASINSIEHQILLTVGSWPQRPPTILTSFAGDLVIIA